MHKASFPKNYYHMANGQDFKAETEEINFFDDPRLIQPGKL
jgi:hypothetical protein